MMCICCIYLHHRPLISTNYASIDTIIIICPIYDITQSTHLPIHNIRHKAPTGAHDGLGLCWQGFVCVMCVCVFVCLQNDYSFRNHPGFGVVAISTCICGYILRLYMIYVLFTCCLHAIGNLSKTVYTSYITVLHVHYSIVTHM